GGCGIAVDLRGVATRQGVPEVVKRSAPGDQRLLKCRERLADVDKYLLIILGGRTAEGLTVAAGQLRIGPDERRHLLGTGRHLALVEQWPDALRPKRIVRAIPAEPALPTDIDQADRVAIDRFEARAARHAISPMALRLVTGGAGDQAIGR